MWSSLSVLKELALSSRSFAYAFDDAILSFLGGTKYMCILK